MMPNETNRKLAKKFETGFADPEEQNNYRYKIKDNYMSTPKNSQDPLVKSLSESITKLAKINNWKRPTKSIEEQLKEQQLQQQQNSPLNYYWGEHKSKSNFITEADLLAAAGAAAAPAGTGLIIGTAASYGINSAWDALDSNTWKHGGSRRKTQLELLGLGDKGTFVQAWKDVRNALEDDGVRIGNRPTRHPMNLEGIRKDMESENEAYKEQVHKLNPDLKARQEEERRQREANRQQDELEQRGKIQ